MPKVSILIPAYNEKDTILEILRRIDDVVLNIEKEVIIIDDCSTDGTRDIVKNLDPDKCVVILQEKNQGKGAALKAGIAQATGDFVIFQDADLEYSPSDFPALLAPLLENRADMVIGSRVLSGDMRLFGKNRVHLSSYINCKVITGAMNLFYGQNGTDYYGCYKVFRKDTLDSVSILADRFEYDSELLCKLFKRQVRFAEVPTQYNPRGPNKGKKISWRDFPSIFFSVVKWRFLD